MKCADGTSINTNPPICTCEVGIRREDDIKGKGCNKKKGGEEKERREHSVIKFITKLKNNI